MRDVTGDEVAFFRENGWARLERLIEPELAAEMLAIARREMEDRDDLPFLVQASGSSEIHDREQWRDWHFPGRDQGVEPFRSLAYSSEIGANAMRLQGRDVAIRYHADLIAVKMPAGHVASLPTAFHQDWVNFPFDRVGMLTFWIALDEITPKRGAMRFYSGSHRAGPLGKMGFNGVEAPEYYPGFKDRYPLSPVLHLQPGDATVHDALVVHGAPANSTDKPRWAFLCTYIPADTCYTGAPHVIYSADLGLEVGAPITHPQHPVVYPQP